MRLIWATIVMIATLASVSFTAGEAEARPRRGIGWGGNYWGGGSYYYPSYRSSYYSPGISFSLGGYSRPGVSFYYGPTYRSYYSPYRSYYSPYRTYSPYPGAYSPYYRWY